MQQALGSVAAVLTWLGWLTISPALGFPTLGTVAMVNRVFSARIPEAGHDPNFWLGWVILVAALACAAAALFILERVRLVRATIRTGVIYGAALWLLSGVVIMPFIGLIAPPEFVIPGVQPPDPMQATVMMHTLGPLAAVAALIAWVLFGAILGATGSTREGGDAAPVRVLGR